MTPTKFPESNCLFGPPVEFEESQIGTLHGCKGRASKGNLDGIDFIVTAWQPSPEEIKAIVDGAPIFLTVLWDALPPHLLSTSFSDATSFM